MRVCRPEFLQQLRTLASEFDTFLIFDEVMTGFGRTGADFACKKAQVEPDLICLSKGITGGFLPLAVTVATERIYESFYSDDLTHIPHFSFYDKYLDLFTTHLRNKYADESSWS